MLGNMDAHAIKVLLEQMFQSTGVVLELFFLTILFAIPLGLLLSFGRMSKHFLLREPIRLYLLIMRGTPLLLQLIFFFFVPGFINRNFTLFFKDNGLDYRFIAAVVTFSLNYAAYFAEIFRSGIESIPKGQYEAAAVLGFSKMQTFLKIILPQVCKRVLPPMSNEFMTLVKDTSLAYVIGVEEIFKLANATMSAQFSTLPLVICGLFYLVMNMIVAKGFSIAERRLSYYR